MLEPVPFEAAPTPIDLTGQFLNDPTLVDQVIELAATNGDFGSLVSFQGSIGRNPALMEATRSAWIERKAANLAMHFAVAGFCTRATPPIWRRRESRCTRRLRMRRAR